MPIQSPSESRLRSPGPSQVVPQRPPDLQWSGMSLRTVHRPRGSVPRRNTAPTPPSPIAQSTTVHASVPRGSESAACPEASHRTTHHIAHRKTTISLDGYKLASVRQPGTNPLWIFEASPSSPPRYSTITVYRSIDGSYVVESQKIPRSYSEYSSVAFRFSRKKLLRFLLNLEGSPAAGQATAARDLLTVLRAELISS